MAVILFFAEAHAPRAGLLARSDEPMYGYQIAKTLERFGDGVLSGKQSALYPVLRNLAMLPLGIVYFTLAVTLLSLALSFIAAPLLVWTGIASIDNSLSGWQLLDIYDGFDIRTSLEPWALPLLFIGGILLLFATLHIARGIGHLHGLFAKTLAGAADGVALFLFPSVKVKSA